jgi:hypothetical protein
MAKKSDVSPGPVKADRKGKVGRAAPTPEALRELDANLRHAYQTTLEEGVPDRFVQLLSALKAKETGEAGDGS